MRWRPWSSRRRREEDLDRELRTRSVAKDGGPADGARPPATMRGRNPLVVAHGEVRVPGLGTAHLPAIDPGPSAPPPDGAPGLGGPWQPLTAAETAGKTGLHDAHDDDVPRLQRPLLSPGGRNRGVSTGPDVET